MISIDNKYHCNNKFIKNSYKFPLEAANNSDLKKFLMFKNIIQKEYIFKNSLSIEKKIEIIKDILPFIEQKNIKRALELNNFDIEITKQVLLDMQLNSFYCNTYNFKYYNKDKTIKSLLNSKIKFSYLKINVLTEKKQKTSLKNQIKICSLLIINNYNKTITGSYNDTFNNSYLKYYIMGLFKKYKNIDMNIERKKDLKRINKVGIDIKKAIKNLYSKYIESEKCFKENTDLEDKIDIEKDNQLDLNLKISILKEKIKLSELSLNSIQNNFYTSGGKGGLC